MTSTLVLGEARVDRALTRLAYEIVERNSGLENVLLVGIQRRGVLVARAMAARLERIGDTEIPVHTLDTTPYRDDRNSHNSEVDRSEINADLTERDVVLVDDVLFTGRTVRAALDALVRFGRPRTIQLAVLVDRGHREYPIRPDYVGRTIQTKHRERVSVRPDEGLAIYVDE